MDSAGMRRRMGPFDAAMLVVGSMVGVGIFIVPGIVADHVSSSSAFLGVWIASGVVALCGALANGELGAAFPRGGGEYVYLREAYGPFVGFLSGWSSFWIGFPGSVATSAAAFARIVAELAGIRAAGVELAIALALVFLFTAVNSRGIDTSRWTQNLLTALLLVLFVTFLGVGLTSDAHAPALATTARRSDLALATVPVFFAYLGWNAATYVAGEIRNPRRTLAIALIAGTLSCVVLYVAMNLVFLRVSSLEEMAGRTDVAHLVATRLLGRFGGVVVMTLIAVAMLTSLQASILTGPRIYQAMAEDSVFFRKLAEVHPRRRVPVNSIVTQGLIAAALLLTGTFERLLTFTTAAIVLFSTITVLGVLVLRVRRPSLPRPFRTPLYPLVPLVFILANVWLLSRLLATGAREALAGMAIIAAGIPAYALFRRRGRAQPNFDQSPHPRSTSGSAASR